MYQLRNVIHFQNKLKTTNALMLITSLSLHFQWHSQSYTRLVKLKMELLVVKINNQIPHKINSETKIIPALGRVVNVPV